MSTERSSIGGRSARARPRRSRSGRPARAARRARRAPRRAGSRRPTPHARNGHRALLERGGDHGALALHRAHQHADLLGRHAAGDQLLGLGGHGLRLRALRAAAPEAHAAAARAGELLRPRRIGARPRPPRRGCAGPSGSCARASPPWRRAARARSRAGSSRRPAEAVDRLVVVADHGHVRCSSTAGAAACPGRSSCPGTRPRARAGSGRATRSRTCGRSCSSRNARRIRSPKSSAPRSAEQAVVVRVEARELELARGAGAFGVGRPRPPSRARPRRGSSSAETISSFSRSMRATKLASSGAGLPRISWWRSDRSSIRSSSSASRSAGVTGERNGSTPASSASSRSRRRQKAWNVVDVQLLVGRLEQRLEALAHLGGGGRREGQRQDPLGGPSLLHEPGEAAA